MKYKEIVEKQKIEKRKENIEEVREQVNSEWVVQKIENHLKRFPCLVESKEDLVKAILTSDVIASFFAKDPSKQNISEDIAQKILNVAKLPSQGRNCIRFTDDGEITSVAKGATKSADFKIEDVYFTQKYTVDSGGAQDNQFHDVYFFLKCGSKKHRVGALVDGDFWDNGKREELKKLFAENENVEIKSVDDYMGDK